MAQFDVYPNPSKISKAHYPYLVDIQSSLLSDLATRIVIPLGKRSAFGGEAMQGLTPEISFADQALLLLTPQISAVPEKHLKSPIGSLSRFRDQIVGALDLVGYQRHLTPCSHAGLERRKIGRCAADC